MSPKEKEPIEEEHKFCDFIFPVLRIPVDHAPDITLGLREAAAVNKHQAAIKAFLISHQVAKQQIDQLTDTTLSSET